ncbi:BLOC-3 complex member HPS4 isoform 2-T2 [Pholidichthys leucotaenia]
MAQFKPSHSPMCNYFFLYDGSKVTGEADPTRDGICYFYPEETPLDKQELLCGQLAGVGRCVSELSSSPVRTLRLRHNKFAICMKDNFFWALGCPVEVPTVSVCDLLDQLIDLFCFYNGPVHQCYQLNSQEVLAARWARYLSHLQSGSSRLNHVFSCLRTIDSTNVDPLLLLKAALILQACQRCPLVLAGCILFRGRVVSTQMSPELTMKVMVHESEKYTKTQRPNGTGTSSLFGSAVSSTTVFLTGSELECLRSAPVGKSFSSAARKDDAPTMKTRLSRTLSDTPSIESETSNPSPSQSPLKVSFSPNLSESSNSMFSPAPSQSTPVSLNHSPPSLMPASPNGKSSLEAREQALNGGVSHGIEGMQEAGSVIEEAIRASSGEGACGMRFDSKGDDYISEMLHERQLLLEDNIDSHRSDEDQKEDDRDPIPPLPPRLSNSSEENPLTAMTLYTHRVNSLVLALLVEPHFMTDTAATEEVYHSSLASLNGLEAHLRTIPPATPGVLGPYVFAHFDCIQSTLTTNLSGRSGGAQDPFIRATSLLHSHFYNTETLQEAIIRSASAAFYGTRSVAQETFFQQCGGSQRNSGIPNHQDSAFSLPSKARHRLLKHGVNLL